MERVLVVRRGGLGDTLLMLPSLRALRRRHPGEELHFAGVPEFAAVLLAHGAVDAVRSTELLALWTLGTPRRDEALRRLAEFGLVIADDPLVAAVRGEGAVWFDPIALAGRGPAAMQIAGQLGLRPRWPDDAQLLPAGRQRGGPVMLAPGSGSPRKCWPQERWLELAVRLAPRGLEVVVGPTEIERSDPRRWPWPDGVTFVVENDLLRLARRIEAGSHFVGNDSGTTHLAAMLGVPTTALFGPTEAAVWAPAGAHVTVLCGDASFDGVSVGEVAAAVAR
jgi:ADP-heptose:LPS heptosyltransferase